MENFIGSVFPLLVIAAVVIFRVVSAVRGGRRNRYGNESSPAKPAPPKAARGFVPWEDEFRDNASSGIAGSPGNAPPVRPAQTTPGGGDEAFSAWALSVDDDPPGPRLPATPQPAPLLALSARSFSASGRQAAVPENMAPERLLKPAPKSPGRRLNGLPPLQQAVVWAEILGAPRGFKD